MPPDKHMLRALNRAAQVASPIRPLGVPADITRLYNQTATQPYFKAHFASVGRYSREVWLARQLPGYTEDQLLHSDFGHIWRAYRKADGDPKQYDRAECTIQALVIGLRAFQWTLRDPWTIASAEGSPYPIFEPLDLRQGSPKLLEHFAATRYELMQYQKLNDNRRTRNLQPASIDWGFVRKFLRHPRNTAEHKGTLCQLVHQTVTNPAWLEAHGFETQGNCECCGRPDNLQHILTGCPDQPPEEDQPHEVVTATYTIEHLGIIPPPEVVYPM